jgi:signal transduction histidine kinase
LRARAHRGAATRLRDALAATGVAALAAGVAERRRLGRHEKELRVMARLARLSSQVADASRDVCAAARDLLAADTAVLFRAFDGELRSAESSGERLPPLRIPAGHPSSPVARAFREGELVFADRGAVLDLPVLRDFGARALLAAPVTRAGSQVGVLVWLWRKPKRRLSVHERRLAEIAAAEKGVVVQREEQLDELERLTRTQMRARLARDLHDSVVQELAVLRMYVHTAARGGTDPGGAIGELLPLMETHVDKAHDELRTLIDTLRADQPPAELSLADVVSAVVDDVASRSPALAVTADVSGGEDLEVRRAVRETVYFVLREALHNAVMHAEASRIDVRVHADPSRVTIEVEDDGRGFDMAAAAAAGGHGLTGMRERAELAGGRLAVQSRPGEGTTVRLNVDDPRPEAPRGHVDAWPG